MKHIHLFLLSIASLIGSSLIAQNTDSVYKQDTVRRTFSATVTITEVMDSAFRTHADTLIVENDIDYTPQKKKRINTNWLIFDLGFANFYDKTAYGSAEANAYLQGGSSGAFTKEDMRLKTIKSSNVNIWLFMQKLNISRNHLNLKYGMGLEMFNFRYEDNITYHKDPNYIYRDTISFKKNKLYTSYVSVPFMLNYDPNPGKKWGLSLSAGILAGYRIGGHTKQKSSEFGKVKQGGSFDLNDWRLAYTGEIGLGPIRIYGSYSIKPLQNNVMDQHPYAIGVRFSNW